MENASHNINGMCHKCSNFNSNLYLSVYTKQINLTKHKNVWRCWLVYRLSSYMSRFIRDVPGAKYRGVFDHLVVSFHLVFSILDFPLCEKP